MFTVCSGPRCRKQDFSNDVGGTGSSGASCVSNVVKRLPVQLQNGGRGLASEPNCRVARSTSSQRSRQRNVEMIDGVGPAGSCPRTKCSERSKLGVSDLLSVHAAFPVTWSKEGLEMFLSSKASRIRQREAQRAR